MVNINVITITFIALTKYIYRIFLNSSKITTSILIQYKFMFIHVFSQRKYFYSKLICTFLKI